MKDLCGQVNIWSTTRRGMKPLLALPPTSLDHHRFFFLQTQDPYLPNVVLHMGYAYRCVDLEKERIQLNLARSL